MLDLQSNLQNGAVSEFHPHPRKHLTGVPWYVMGMMMFACMDAVSKHLTSSLPIIEILWVRYAFFTTFGLIMVMATHNGSVLQTAVPKFQIIRGLCMLGDIGLFTLSFRFLQLAEAHAIAAIAPLMVMALAVPLLGEKVRRSQWIAVNAGFLGVLIIIRPGMAIFQEASTLPFLATVSFSLYLILTRLVGRYDGLWTSVLYTGLVGFCLLSFAIPFSWRTPTADETFWLIVASCLSVGAHICIIRGLSLSEANILQPFNYVLLVGAVVLGFAIFDDLPDIPTIIGALVILGSGLYAWRIALKSKS